MKIGSLAVIIKKETTKRKKEFEPNSDCLWLCKRKTAKAHKRTVLTTNKQTEMKKAELESGLEQKGSTAIFMLLSLPPTFFYIY